MAKWLYNIGRWSFRRKKTVFFGALALLLLVASLGIGMGSSFSSDMSIPGTKSEKAKLVLEEAFGSAGEDAGTIQLIFKAPENETLESESVKALVQSTEQDIAKDPEVASIATLYEANTISADKRIGYSTVTYKNSATDVSEESIDHVLETVEVANSKGLQTELGGSVALSAVGEVGTTSETIGIAVAFLILIITFGSVVAAGLPILIAAIGLGIGILLIMVISNFVGIPTFALALTSMLGLAVGIDYGLFIVSKFKNNLNAGMDRQEAAAMANATAGSAVVFAGLTVIIALLGLYVTGIPFLGAMGLSAAIAVVLSVLVSIVVTPALLGATKKMFAPKEGKASSRSNNYDNQTSSFWGRIVTKFPLPMVIISVLLLGLISLPFVDMQTGLPNHGTKSTDTTERRGYDLLAEGFGPGFNGPLTVVAQITSETSDPAAAITEATKELVNLPNVASVTPPFFNEAGETAVMTLLPNTDPLDSKTGDLVKDIRALNDQDKSNVELLVTGSTAVDIDISDKLNAALPKFAGLIAGLAFVLLAIIFRSLLIPLKAVIGYLLTLTATLGLVVYIVQEGHMASFFGIAETSPVLNFLPVLVAGILFGLAMDYEVFLVSAMRENYTHEKQPKKAILYGLKTNGKVVLAAGLIMITVFASFIFVEDPIVKSMGLALAFGILFDAFIVRLTIVPALMALLGKSAWYFPKWLDRILPKVDIEGESFQQEKGNKLH